VGIADPEHYQAFVLAVERESITGAAKLLGVSRPTLSRRLSALEERLGLALLHRSTRRVSPTPAGRRLYERVQPLLRDLARAEQALLEERDEVQGLLRVSVPPVIAPDLSPVLVHLLSRHPKLEIELTTEVRWAQLRSDGVEVALRVGRVGDPELIQRRLGATEVSAVASPAYLEERGTPADLGALADHRLLRGHDASGLAQRNWPLREGGRLPVSGPFTSNDQRVLLEAAKAGAGVALVSDFNARRALHEGRLVRVLPALLGTTLKIHAVLARRTMQPARVGAFVDALVSWFEDRA